MNKYKAVVLDLDGTFLDSNHSISCAPKRLKILYDDRIKIIIATARGLDAFELLMGIFYDGLILGNGMKIIYNSLIISRKYIKKMI